MGLSDTITYSKKDDPQGKYAQAQEDFNMTCTNRNAAGEDFHGKHSIHFVDKSPTH